jgi:LacI family transcriptional regulator
MNLRNSRLTQGAPTIADVARDAGFSPMTVSRVINGDKNVRESTRQSIQVSIAKLNYAPNLAARTLASADQIRIGMLYSNPSAAYLSRFLVGSLEQARISHAQLVIEKSDEGQSAEDAVRELIQSGIDGLILSPPLCDSEAILALLDKEKVITVLIANWSPPGRSSVVRIDDVEAAATMSRHILALGHRHIGFITGHPAHRASQERLAGFHAAMKVAGIEVDPDYVVSGEFTYRSGMAAAEKLLNLPSPPTAIFASNDDMAAATITVAHRRHIDVPKDLTVCGFDDTDFAKSIWPELTTIHQPIADMARAAVEMLVGQIRIRRSGKEVLRQNALLDFTFVRRESDAPFSGGK